MSQFIPELNGPLHPHAQPITGDSSEDVIQKMDGSEPEKLSVVVQRRTSEALRVFVEKVRGDTFMLNRHAISMLGRRFLMLLWLSDPSLFVRDGKPMSLHEIAKRVRCSPQNLSPTAAELSRTLGLRNSYQAHDSKSERHITERGTAELGEQQCEETAHQQAEVSDEIENSEN